MKNKQAIPFGEVFADLEQDEEFKKADRQLKPYYELVKAIVQRRSELGLTQKDLAEKANTHQSRISKIESAEHDIRISTLVQIAEALESEVSIRLIPIEKPIPVIGEEHAYSLFRLVHKFNGVAAQSFSEGKSNEYSVNPVYAERYEPKYKISI
jgi:transcriptional regulator with XRE-family HTH domain